MNNRNWEAVRRKYMPMAAAATSGDELAVVVDMMLGELNASHMRFDAAEGDPQTPDSQRAGQATAEHPWTMTTAHLGLRFDRSYRAPVAKYMTSSPAARLIT